MRDDDTALLIDVTGDFEEQASRLEQGIDAILLTHGHSDSIGGFAALRRWLEPGRGPIPVYAGEAVIDRLEDKFARLDHCEFRVFEPGDRGSVGAWTMTCCRVPHAGDELRYPTVAWKLTREGHRLVYASDLARPTSGLREFSREAGLFVVDGATHRRRIFSHLRVDQDLPQICQWPVEQILLTQIGRSCPPHEEFSEVVERLCPRAVPAYDGLRWLIP